MVQARPFSFSDGSTDVSLPNTVDASSAGQPWQSGLHSIETAVYLFRIRIIQSPCYQALFHSGQTILEKPTEYAYSHCTRTLAWDSDAPSNIPQPFKRRLRLETLYSLTIMLTPSAKQPDISDIGRELTFEYCVEFIHTSLEIASDPQNRMIFTFHDALRVYFMGRQFLDALWHNFDQLMGIRPTKPDTTPGCPPLPPTAQTDRSKNLFRARVTIEQVNSILGSHGRRWDDCLPIQRAFNSESAHMIGKLDERQKELEGDALGQVSNTSGTGRTAKYAAEPDLEARLAEEWRVIMDSASSSGAASSSIPAPAHGLEEGLGDHIGGDPLQDVGGIEVGPTDSAHGIGHDLNLSRSAPQQGGSFPRPNFNEFSFQ
jgi:hypothetical protein